MNPVGSQPPWRSEKEFVLLGECESNAPGEARSNAKDMEQQAWEGDGQTSGSAGRSVTS